MEATLLVLAAGLGSRYGGLKQLDPVGPNGEILLDYAMFDALRAGFTRIAFVIRREFEAEFSARVAAKYVGRAPVDLVFQAASELPLGSAARPAREKPWGTGHAVWCARHRVAGPFAVIGADDFFGRDAFVQLADFLALSKSGAARLPQYAMAGYRLGRTLSEHGAVARGICAVGPDGRLERVTERTDLRGEAIGPGREWTGDETVSMNCWAFTPEIFPALESQLAAFVRDRGDDPRAEFYLPEAVSRLISLGVAEVWVRPTSARWFGVTYREDKPRVEAALAELVRQGEYPPRLF
jgi:NDP-sugar pyrophosphorylase family protein